MEADINMVPLLCWVHYRGLWAHSQGYSRPFSVVFSGQVLTSSLILWGMWCYYWSSMAWSTMAKHLGWNANLYYAATKTLPPPGLHLSFATKLWRCCYNIQSFIGRIKSANQRVEDLFHLNPKGGILAGNLSLKIKHVATSQYPQIFYNMWWKKYCQMAIMV